MKTALIAGVSGLMAAASSASLVAQTADDWQAFLGIIIGFATLGVFIWATIKNQKRQDAKFEKWQKLNEERKEDP